MLKKKRPGIDVSVVLFYKQGKVPSTIRVSEITLPLATKIPGFITGLSGHQCLNGLMYARQYADERNLEMIVVDLLVEFELPLFPKVMRSEFVKDHDVLNMQRISKDLIEELAAHWQEWISKEPSRRNIMYDWERPSDFVANRPDLIPELLSLDEYKHINIVTHPVKTVFHDKPLTATSFPIGYPRITRASARFHPNIELIL